MEMNNGNTQWMAGLAAGCAAFVLAGCSTLDFTPRGINGDTVLEAASVGAPFRNSVGMSFVPVRVEGLGYTVLMAQHEVTVDQWKAFGRGYNAPGYPQAGNHPAVNVSWEEAKAYCEWLSAKEGRRYRLPTDHEWSCAVGIGGMEDGRTFVGLDTNYGDLGSGSTPEKKHLGIPNIFPWGRGWPPPANSGNYAGQEWLSATPEQKQFMQKMRGAERVFDLIGNYNDGYLFTAPVGIFSSNGLGIHDLSGNVWEWVEDRWGLGENYHVLRGGSWGNRGLSSDLQIGLIVETTTQDNEKLQNTLLASYRNTKWGGDNNIGFRIVLESN